jgi:hypothetical protein
MMRPDLRIEPLRGNVNTRLATQAGTANERALWQICQLLTLWRYQRIGVVGALKHGGKAETLRHIGWHILHGVDRNIGFSTLHCDLQLLDEQALAANFLQAAVQNLVTSCGQRDELNGSDFRETLEQGGYVLGLP